MLDNAHVSEIARRVVRTQVSGASLERVFTEEATDSEGNEALRITLVLKPDAARMLTGDTALDFLVGIQQQLQDAGEDRFPIVEYATEHELGLEEVRGESELSEDDI